jgi:uncharacterized protein (DUF2147 family)
MAIRNRGRLLNTVTALVMTCAGIATFGAVASAADPSGVWLVADQSARIRVEPCADGYWGVIDWERQPGTDAKNPDPAKRGQPMLGVPILIAMKPSQQNEWEGKVYNPKDGGFYRASISLTRPDVLKLEGCMLIFCSGENWTRVANQAQATTGAMASSQPRARNVCPGAPQAAPQRRN